MPLATRWTRLATGHDLVWAQRVDHRLSVPMSSRLTVLDARSGETLTDVGLQPKSQRQHRLWSDGIFIAEGCKPSTNGKRSRPKEVRVGIPGFWLVGDDGPAPEWTISSFDSRGTKVWSTASTMAIYELRVAPEGLWVLGYDERCYMALLDPASGAKRDVFPFEGDAQNVSLAGDRIVSQSRATAPADEKHWGVHVWDRARGWHRPVDRPVWASDVSRDILVYDTGAATDADHPIDPQTVAMRLDTNAELWRTPAGPNITLPIHDGEVAALSRTDAGDVVLTLRDCVSGAPRWTSAPLTLPERGATTLLGDRHVFLDLGERLLIFRRDDGRLIVDEEQIVVTIVPFADGFVTCRSPSGTGAMNELVFVELDG
jgi:hypothetical protein